MPMVVGVASTAMVSVDEKFIGGGRCVKVLLSCKTSCWRKGTKSVAHTLVGRRVLQEFLECMNLKMFFVFEKNVTEIPQMLPKNESMSDHN